MPTYCGTGLCGCAPLPAYSVNRTFQLFPLLLHLSFYFMHKSVLWMGLLSIGLTVLIPTDFTESRVKPTLRVLKIPPFVFS